MPHQLRLKSALIIINNFLFTYAVVFGIGAIVADIVEADLVCGIPILGPINMIPVWCHIEECHIDSG